MDKENIDDRVIKTLAFIQNVLNITNKMVDSEMLKYGGMKKIAKEMEKDGLLIAGVTGYNGAIENVSYIISASGTALLKKYSGYNGAVVISAKDDRLAYHHV